MPGDDLNDPVLSQQRQHLLLDHRLEEPTVPQQRLRLPRDSLPLVVVQPVRLEEDGVHVRLPRKLASEAALLLHLHHPALHLLLPDLRPLQNPLLLLLQEVMTASKLYLRREDTFPQVVVNLHR